MQLSRYASQRWIIAADGRSMACARGSQLHDASVIVQLYSRSIPIAVEAFDRAAAIKLKRRAAYLSKCAKARVQPKPAVLTPEEESWQGGPGFCVDRANATLQAQLAEEQAHGLPFTAAAVGDGSWDPSLAECAVTRAALLHDGTIVGGAIDHLEVVGGDRTNYDGELAHKLDVLAVLPVHTRLFYIFDSTSPMEAGEHFRRSTTTARARAECDDWQGTAMELEQRLDVIAYWWCKSHIGHLPEAAADALAKRYLGSDPLPLPQAHSRHVSIRFHAKGSERDLMLAAAQLSLIRRHTRELPLGDAIRVQACEHDALRSAKLCEIDTVLLMCMRDDSARLQASKAYPNLGSLSVGGLLRREGCPCGGGPQTRHHLLWECSLRSVRNLRQHALRPAVTALGKAIWEEHASVSGGGHMECSMCIDALEQGMAPKGRNGIVGITPVRMDAQAAGDACLRLVLGIIRIEGSARQIKLALRAARPMLRAVLGMQRAAEQASARRTMAVALQARQLRQQRDALHHLRAWTWLHPKPSGGTCMCCPGRVHRARDAAAPVVPTIRPITAQAAVWAAMQGEDSKGGYTAVTARLKRQLTRDETRAAEAAEEAAWARRMCNRRETVVPQPRPHRLGWERRRCTLEYMHLSDEARRARLKAAATAMFLTWWVTLAASHARRAARRRRVDSAAEAVRVKVTKEMEARRQAAKLRQQRERERRMEAVRAVLREASGACARARAEVAKRVRGALEVGRVACAAASEELERATSRQIIDWQSRRWAVGWSVGWAAERAARERSAGIL